MGALHEDAPASLKRTVTSSDVRSVVEAAGSLPNLTAIYVQVSDPKRVEAIDRLRKSARLPILMAGRSESRVRTATKRSATRCYAGPGAD
jgi:hypothetical protein